MHEKEILYKQIIVSYVLCMCAGVDPVGSFGFEMPPPPPPPRGVARIFVRGVLG